MTEAVSLNSTCEDSIFTDWGTERHSERESEGGREGGREEESERPSGM